MSAAASPPSSGTATTLPSVVTATTSSAARAGLLEGQRRRLAVGAEDVDAERPGVAGGGDDEVAVGVGEHRLVGAEHRDRRRGVGELDGAALGRRAVRAQEHDLPRLLVDEHGVAVGGRRRQRAAAARDDRFDVVGRGDRQQLLAGQLPRLHRGVVDDQRAAVDGVDLDVGADGDAGRVGHPLDRVVDDRHRALGGVVDHDDALGLVDVEVGAGIGDADRGSDLADLAVDVADVPRVALEQPGAAVVGLGLRALPALGLQGRGDDGADHQAEHDEHAAGDAAPGAPSSWPGLPVAAVVVHWPARSLLWSTPLRGGRRGRVRARQRAGPAAVSADAARCWTRGTSSTVG